MRRALVSRGIAQDTELDAIDKKAHDSIDLAWEFAEAAPYPAPEDALTDVYVKYP
jgi:TPP-dependent pyruvate/acetoin dehydrogenase alpha subunit